MVERVVEAVQANTGVDHDEAREYVDALLDARVLTPVAAPR